MQLNVLNDLAEAKRRWTEKNHGFYNHDLRAIYELVNLDVAVEELQRGILVLCCLRPNWPESILSDALSTGCKF